MVSFTLRPLKTEVQSPIYAKDRSCAPQGRSDGRLTLDSRFQVSTATFLKDLNPLGSDGVSLGAKFPATATTTTSSPTKMSQARRLPSSLTLDSSVIQPVAWKNIS